MKRSYSNQLNEMIRWLTNTNQLLGSGMPFPVLSQEADTIIGLGNGIASAIRDEYPFYAKEIPEILKLLFRGNAYSGISVNKAAFGELFIICKHIDYEPVNMNWWRIIHPRIIAISRDLFADGYYSSSAEKAVKEVEVRLREKFSELKPGVGVPTKIGEVIGALLSENGLFHFCDTTTASGKDYRRGVHALFEGFMAAYRNPSAHANLKVDRRTAMEQIMLASQLMHILDIQN